MSTPRLRSHAPGRAQNGASSMNQRAPRRLERIEAPSSTRKAPRHARRSGPAESHRHRDEQQGEEIEREAVPVLVPPGVVVQQVRDSNRQAAEPRGDEERRVAPAGHAQRKDEGGRDHPEARAPRVEAQREGEAAGRRPLCHRRDHAAPARPGGRPTAGDRRDTSTGPLKSMASTFRARKWLLNCP